MSEPPPLTRAHALFLDFDGTLVEIAPRPGDVALAASTRAALDMLATTLQGAVAVISGRDVADIDAHLAPMSLPVAGSHGAERRDATGHLHRKDGDGAALARAADEMARFADAHGLLVERKRAAVSLHYRDRPELGEGALSLARGLAAAEPRLRLIAGKMVAELALSGHDKGAALAAYLAEPPFAGRVPVMAGDDTTDEDAFAAAARAGGWAIKIGPGATQAAHRLPDTAAFLGWLTAAAAGLGKDGAA